MNNQDSGLPVRPKTEPEGQQGTGQRNDMALPFGMTCGDCGHFRFCSQFIGPEIDGNNTCDWAPSRFVPSLALARRGKTAIQSPASPTADTAGAQGGQ